MKISRGFAQSCLLTVAASPVFATGFSLGDVANAVSGAQGSNNKAAAAAPSSQTAGLLSALTSQLNVTPEQAVGGTGAMLGLAKNQLSSTDYSQLGKSVPGLDKLAGNNSLGSLGFIEALLGQQTVGYQKRRMKEQLPCIDAHPALKTDFAIYTAAFVGAGINTHLLHIPGQQGIYAFEHFLF